MKFGLFTLTFLVLLVIKLAGLAAISWPIVFLPLIIGFGLFLLAAFFMALAQVKR